MENIKENVEEFDSRIRIASDVIGKIAAIAALEVDGVTAMGNNVSTELLGKVGVKNVLKNTRVEIIGREVRVGVIVTVEYGYNIPVISQKVQAKVKQAIENMTGLDVTDVNVRIAGISLVKEG